MSTFKIVLCISSLGSGGAERQMLTLARGLGALPGVEVRLALIHGGGALESQAQGVAVHHLTPSPCWRWRDVPPAMWALVSLCRKFRPHAVYSFEPLMNEMAYVAARSSGARIYWGIRCSLGLRTEFSLMQRLVRRVEARMSPLADGIIANAQAGARDHVNAGYAARKMVVIPNGVDIQRFAPDLAAGQRMRAALGLPPDALVVGYVSRHTPMKDVSTFLEAAGRVSLLWPGVFFVCVGHGMAECAVRALGARVRCLEFCEDMPALYNGCTCTVLSSLCEGLPNVLVESMACGIPCACTDAGDSAFVVGETGFVSAAGDAATLAQNIARLLEEAHSMPETWRRRSLAAQQRVRAEYSPEQMVSATYQTVKNRIQHSQEVLMRDAQQGFENDEARFGFGENWCNYIQLMDEKRIGDAVSHLQEMLKVQRLDGMRLLDIGSGSGLFSLAATRLGATVHSFDYDANSVAATRALRQHFHTGAGLPEEQWTVEQGSVLDDAYMAGLGTFDLVYSWGVLHHTGQQWKAIDLASRAVAPKGTLFIALYNDQGLMSAFWTKVKRLYNAGIWGKRAVCAVFIPVCFVNELLMSTRRHGNPLYNFRHAKERGMSPVHDWYDWLGGYPFEVSSPEQVVDFLVERGFWLRKITTVGGGLGNNQFILQRQD